jgi:hypothetical protein
MNVASLAGLPKPIVARADAIAHRFASCFDDVAAPSEPEAAIPTVGSSHSPSRNLRTALCRRLLLGVQRSTLTPTALGQIHRQCRQLFAGHHAACVVESTQAQAVAISVVPPTQPPPQVPRTYLNPPRPAVFHRPPPPPPTIGHNPMYPPRPIQPQPNAIAGRYLVSQAFAPRPVFTGSQAPPATQSSAPPSQAPFRRG